MSTSVLQFASETFHQERVLSLDDLLSDRFPDSKEYIEMVRRLPKKEKWLLEKQMHSLLRKDHDIFLSLVKEGNAKAIQEVKNYPIHALFALRQKEISPTTFATLILPWASLDDAKECIRLFNEEGEINPEARDFMQQAFYFEKEISEEDENKVIRFFRLMKNEGPLEQQFFLENPKENLELEDLRFRIKEIYKNSYFSECIKDGVLKIIIPSTKMMQHFLNLRYGEDVVTMNFVLGFSSCEDIEKNGRNGTRDVGMRFPGTSLPDKVHGNLSTQGTDFSHHDIFHCHLASSIPVKIRNFFIDIAKMARDQKCGGDQDDAWEALYEVCIDMELYWFHLRLIDSHWKSIPLGHFLIKELLNKFSSYLSKIKGDKKEFIKDVKNLIINLDLPGIDPLSLSRLDRFI